MAAPAPKRSLADLQKIMLQKKAAAMREAGLLDDTTQRPARRRQDKAWQTALAAAGGADAGRQKNRKKTPRAASASAATTAPGRTNSKRARAQSRGPAAAAGPAIPDAAMGSRRSPRVATLPPVDYTPAGESSEFAAASAAAAPASASAASPGPLRAPAPPPPGALKTLDARLDYMASHYLGKEIPMSLAGSGKQAKAAVIWEVCGQQPKFSKYTGAAEYRNAMVLFVNVDAPGGGQFPNQFLDGGRRMTWYASSTKHEQSNDVLRLRYHSEGFRAGSGGAGNDDDDDVDGKGSGGGSSDSGSSDDGAASFSLAPARIGLACRLKDEPYVWCGELALHTFAAGTRPLQFTWNLLNRAALKKSAPFQRILRVAAGE